MPTSRLHQEYCLWSTETVFIAILTICQMCIGIIKMLGSDAVCSGHLQFDRMRYAISSGVSRSAWPRCGVGTQELTSMGTTEACANSKCNRQAQAGRKQSTVQSLMVYRHRCVMFMDAVQTESSSLKRRWKGTGGKKSVHPQVSSIGVTQRWFCNEDGKTSLQQLERILQHPQVHGQHPISLQATSALIIL